MKAVCIMDEVHGLPAVKVNEAFGSLRTKMKIGLTATPYRVSNFIILFY
jgi:superfamily II DNA or RNA helicase